MAKNLLTDRQVKLAKPKSKEYLISDGSGLFLRIRPSGSRDWLFIYTFAGKRRKMGLGSFESVSLARARSEADKAHDCIAKQVDPQLFQRQLVAEQTAQRKSFEDKKSRLTVERLFLLWEKRVLKDRKDKGAEVRRSFEKDVFPRFREVAVEDITRAMIIAVLDTVVDRGAPVIARNLLGDLRQMYGFAIVRGLAEQDPTSRLKRDDFGKKVERDRVLSESEIRALPSMMVAGRLAETTKAAIWIMLSTCCRVGEISRAEWKDVNLQEMTWRIPTENAKNAKEHTVHLSQFALSQFEVLKRLSNNSPWVLPARWTNQHLCVKSLTKQIGDRQRGDKASMKCRSLQTNALKLPGGKWTPHDLRRTGATMMGSLGVRPDIIEKCLNHAEQNKVVRVYQRQKLVAEKAQAWKLLGEMIVKLLHSGTSKVSTINKVAA